MGGFELTDRVAIVTGDSGGIGKGVDLAMASDAASWITGASIQIDGGWIRSLL